MDRLSGLGLQLEGTHVVVTGGAGLIGRTVVDDFVAAGAHVSSVDITYPAGAESKPTTAYSTLYCDVSSEDSVHLAFQAAIQAHGPVEVCVALASLDLSVLQHSSLADASFAQLQRVLNVNIAGTWLTAREWILGLRQAKSKGTKLKNPNLVIVGSESGHFGERTNADYSLAKSAVQGGLLQSLRQDVVREYPGARVNAVAPGPVATKRWVEECEADPEQYYLEAQATTALAEPIPTTAVAKAILMLASPMSSHTHGQVLNVDGGKQGKVVWPKNELAQAS